MWCWIQKKTFEPRPRLGKVHAVKSRRVARLIRCLVVLPLLCSWLAISNHCALAAVATAPEASSSECPFHSQPKKKQPVVQECCKTLRAVLAKTGKDWARDDARFLTLDLTVSRALIPAETHNLVPLLLDTGPPGKTSFVRLIGSLHAHAPPPSA